MKSLKMSSIIAMVAVLLCNLTVIHAMEEPKKVYIYIKMAISDIQQFAEDASQETGKKYRIITDPIFVAECLRVLGLNEENTPLDIRYHYELLKQKLLKDNPSLYSTVEKAYTQLMKMLLVFGYEFSDLLAMNFTQIEEMELEDIGEEPYAFAKYKNKVIDQTIKELQQRKLQYIFNEPIEPLNTIKKLLNLPSDASASSIEKHYNSYIEKNSPNRLIALKNMNTISNQDLKDIMFAVERIKEAYAEYLKEK